MKLWWPHNEILIASLMAYRDTKDEKYLEWFFKTAEYCKTCFADDVCGEWYGYLRRDGKPTEPPCKGSTFKGRFPCAAQPDHGGRPSGRHSGRLSLHLFQDC